MRLLKVILAVNLLILVTSCTDLSKEEQEIRNAVENMEKRSTNKHQGKGKK